MQALFWLHASKMAQQSVSTSECRKSTELGDGKKSLKNKKI